MLGTPADARAIERAATHDYPDNVVKRFVGHSTVAKGVLHLRVRWLGYDAAHDTDESIGNLAEDVPNLVQAYLLENRHLPVCARVLRTYFPE